MAGEKRIACVDLNGTVLQHKNKERPVPLMPQVVEGLQAKGWEIVLSTVRWDAESARVVLKAAGLNWDFEIIHTQDKAEPVRELLRREPDLQELLFIDDRPDNLDSVCAVADDRIRAIGFTGSRKYCPQLAVQCMRLGIELALSAPDLAEALQVPLPRDAGNYNLLPEEWAWQLAGLDHPMSTTDEAETNCFNHRIPMLALRASARSWWLDAWPNLGWITCQECVWKALVESVVEASGQNRAGVLGDASSAEAYEEQLAGGAEAVRDRLKPQLAVALDAVIRGMAKVGVEAENCRPLGRFIARRRVESAMDRLARIFGRAGWLDDARWMLEETKTRTLSF